MSSSKKGELQPNWNIQIRKASDIHNDNGLTNKISTTKYTLLTWLPKSIWDQFRRVANVYFLFISILMLIGTYAPELYESPLNPFSTIGTLIFVLLVTSFKEGYEDFQRARSDQVENSKKVTVVRFHDNGMKEEVVESENIRAGDIIKLTGQTGVPVDMLLILTSNYTDGNQCYIETSNLDGETNLKLREAPQGLLDSTVVQTAEREGEPHSMLCTGRVEFEPPNKNMHNFLGTLHLEGKEPIPLSMNNLLLRSCSFCNTDWCFGIAIYTGQETKIQMNNMQAPSKMSKIESYLNQAIKLIFLAQLSLVIISVASIYFLGCEKLEEKFPYVFPPGLGSGSILPLWLESFFVFFLLYNNFIPISLYVSIEMVNIGQAFLMSRDESIYDPTLDMHCSVRSSNLCQELGLVSNIFSDKTGTLTRNEMKFVKFVLDSRLYDVSRDSADYNSIQAAIASQLQASGSAFSRDGSRKTLTTQQKIFAFCRCLATCHTVVRDKTGEYRAESPDELALIYGVGNFDCGLLERGTAHMICDIGGEKFQYEIFAVNAFNSDRKRMSLLIRDNNGEYILLCKGADNIMLPLCDIPDENERKELDKSLMDLAVLGLRTLCISQKVIPEEEALAWIKEYKEASASMQDRSERLANAAAKIEQQMTLLGVTAIEDRLQDEVPEVIESLAKAGIVLWMLTGDKEETAVNIGKSCNLVLRDTQLFFISKQSSEESYHNRLKSIYEDLSNPSNFDKETKKYISNSDGSKTSSSSSSSSSVSNSNRVFDRDVVLVMDGPSFEYFDFENPDHSHWFLEIGKCCRSVIACRLTPVQKQRVVALVKNGLKPKAITLAIGDGANDVPMIMEGNVGVGIFGKEGRQAANNADFAIGQFKFLKKLILAHGRWNYSRQSRVFLYCMHKNMCIVLTLYWFSYFTAMSGTSDYESWVYTAFNFALGLPIVIYGIADKDLSEEFVMSHPEVYSTGRKNVYLSPQSIGTWIFNAWLYAIVVCLLFYYAMKETFLTYCLYCFGTSVFLGLVFALQIKVAFLHHEWTKWNVFVMALSIGGMFLYLIVIEGLFTDYTAIGSWVYDQDVFWLMSFFFIPITAGLIDVVGYYVRFFFYPTDEMIYREQEHKELFEKELALWPCHKRSLSSSPLLPTHALSSTSSSSVSPTSNILVPPSPIPSPRGVGAESGNGTGSGLEMGPISTIHTPSASQKNPPSSSSSSSSSSKRIQNNNQNNNNNMNNINNIHPSPSPRHRMDSDIIMNDNNNDNNNQEGKADDQTASPFSNLFLKNSSSSSSSASSSSSSSSISPIHERS